VLIASFALDYGDRADALFGELARRMDDEPGLAVRMFVNVHRDKSTEPEPVLVRTFAERFRGSIWPGKRLPVVYYDPRALAMPGGPRACLHAKCVVIDDTRAFVTSANFTEAAQARNIEAGVVVEDAAFARQLRAQFDGLVEAGVVRVVAGLGGGA
jgi:phosphatidylserine/phosphatidylglycerophosphate/cardiolipin synthase-like enzyme